MFSCRCNDAKRIAFAYLCVSFFIFSLTIPVAAQQCESEDGPFDYEIYQIIIPDSAFENVVSSISLGDFDADGDADIIAISNGTSLQLLKNDLEGSGQFSVVAIETFTNTIDFAVIRAGDLNGSGGTDVVFTTAASGGSEVIVLLNYDSAMGDSWSGSSYSVGVEPSSIAIADLDLDGDNDLITANWVSDNLSVLINDGTGSFGNPIVVGVSPLGAGNTLRVVEAGDLDCDGYPDLVVSYKDDSTSDGSVIVLLNKYEVNETIAFEDEQIYDDPVENNPFSLELVDLNNDGMLDIAVGNQDSNSVSVMLNNRCSAAASSSNEPSAAQAQAAQTFVVDFGAPLPACDGVCLDHQVWSVTSGDYDLDGDIDLAVSAGAIPAQATILFNDGLGGFSVDETQAICLSGVDNARPAVSGDFNNDGRKDIAVGDFNFFLDSNISVILNDSSPPTAEILRIDLPSGSTPYPNINLSINDSSVIVGAAITDLGPLAGFFNISGFPVVCEGSDFFPNHCSNSIGTLFIAYNLPVDVDISHENITILQSRKLTRAGNGPRLPLPNDTNLEA